jgi:hypothetical protein
MLNIARMTEFDAFDRHSCIVCLAWLAREYLAEAERKEEVGFAPRIEACREAASALDAAYMLLRREAMTVKADDAANALDLIDRARMAARAAAENGSIALRYHIATTRREHTDWEHQHVSKTIAVFKRAAETARSEAHRALAALCELFPDAVPMEEDT